MKNQTRRVIPALTYFQYQEGRQRGEMYIDTLIRAAFRAMRDYELRTEWDANRSLRVVQS